MMGENQQRPAPVLRRWSLDELRSRLQGGADRDLVARERLMPRDEDGAAARPIDPPPGVTPREGAVLLLVYPHADDLYVPLTVRPLSLRMHSGEVSLPGGRADPDDGALEQTALREAWEELGVVPDAVEIVAALTPVWIPVSNFHLSPYVGFTAGRPPFNPSPDEVAALIETPLSMLADPAIIHTELRDLRGRLLHVPYFLINGYKVWGATAMVLAQLVGRLTEETAR